MCGHTFLYSPPVRAVKRLLDARASSASIYFISSSRVNLGLHQRDVSVIWDLGPHDFSILLLLARRDAVAVRAVGRDSIVAGHRRRRLRHPRASPRASLANVELSWLAPSKLRRTVIVGSEKMVVYDDGAAEPMRIFDHGVVYRDPETFGEYHLSYRTGDIVSPKLETHEPLAAELAGLRRRDAARRADASSTRSSPATSCGSWRPPTCPSCREGARSRRGVRRGSTGWSRGLWHRRRASRMPPDDGAATTPEPAGAAPYRLLRDVRLGRGVVIQAFTNLYGCAIGDGTRIGTFVEIQRGAVIGARCKIQSHTFVCDGRRIDDEVFVGHGVDVRQRQGAAGDDRRRRAPDRRRLGRCCGPTSRGGRSSAPGP